MATTDEKVDKLETRFSTLEQQFAITMAKVDSLAEEAKQQREDIRQLNVRIDSMQARIDSKFDNLTNQIHNLTIAAVVGFSAIVLAVGGILFTALK
ncbi:MAG: hypothetical protein IKT98_07310 [Selenomonadaceae bacterium]|nr:hypothetical protein [Selenomonadaceae bacterium]